MSHAGSSVGRSLDWHPAAFLGTLSYSFCLWQTICLNHFWRAPGTAFPINGRLALLTALASYKLIEQPFLKLKGLLQALAGAIDGPSKRKNQASKKLERAKKTPGEYRAFRFRQKSIQPTCLSSAFWICSFGT